ncbi:MAG: SDR family oxidoreductase [bacterium]
MNQHPDRRLLNDIANTILFLCSQQAKYITGAVIHVMGGMDLFTF